jgi:hypothetical protein
MPDRIAANLQHQPSARDPESNRENDRALTNIVLLAKTIAVTKWK